MWPLNTRNTANTRFTEGHLANVRLPVLCSRTTAITVQWLFDCIWNLKTSQKVRRCFRGIFWVRRKILPQNTRRRSMKEETQSQLLASIHICTCAHTLMNIHTRTCTSHTKYNKNKQNSQSRTAVSRGGSVRHGDMWTNAPKLAGRQNEPIDSTKYSTRFIVRICTYCLKLLRFYMLHTPHTYTQWNLCVKRLVE